MLYKYVSYNVIFYYWMQKQLYHDISQRVLSFFHLIRICYVYILFNINKFHIKYITDMMHLQIVIKKKYNSKCMSKYKMLKRIICFNVSMQTFATKI